MSHGVGKGIPGWAHYRASIDLDVSCGSCLYYKGNICTMFENSPVASTAVCDEWAGLVEYDPTPKHTADPVDRSLEGEDVMRMAILTEALEPTQKSTGALYLVAHAKTRYNKPGQAGDMVQGWRDIPLDGDGRKQAAKIGKFLKAQGVEKIYTSDLKRAAQTAEVASRASGLTPVVSKDYRPWNLGDFAGHSSSDVLPKLGPYMKEKSDQPVDGGESFDTFTSRFVPALEKILQEVQKGKTVALVAHSRNIELAQGWLGGRGPRKQIDPRAIQIDTINPSTIVKVTNDGNRWKMTEIDDLAKGQANPCEVNLRVHGVTRHADSNLLVYRMDTRDGHYVGRTNPTNHRAVKGDILSLQVGDLRIDSNGDPQWINPNVLGHHDEIAHSWKDLSQIAGNQFEKDSAPGPAGDVPPAGDEGPIGMPSAATMAAVGTGEGGSGPTISSVHVNRPLKSISIGYMGRNRRLSVKKADKKHQIIYGVVLEPNSLDTQDDFMLPDQVEKAAHRYMKKVARGQASITKIQHRKIGFHKNRPSVVPVESFIAPMDFSYDGKETVKKGTWVMALHVEDPNVWEQVLGGEFTGLSIGGTGIRQEAPVNPPLEEFNDNPAGWFSPGS